jgi:zinc transporter 1/2/3
MLSWYIPLKNKNLTNNSSLLSLANAFSGGIFLMLAFGHMMPHSIEVLKSLDKDINITFKFVLFGYLLVFFIEKIAFNSHSHGDDNHSHDLHTHKIENMEIKNDINGIQDNTDVNVPVLTPDYVPSSSATVIESEEVI